jgi:hypothetical protein
MRLTNSCEYGRECAAGQPGAGRFFEAAREKALENGDKALR